MPAVPCRHLRTKQMYVPEQAFEAHGGPRPRRPAPPGADFCWCNRTQTAVGLDDQLVSVPACRDPARPCYVGS